MLGPDRPNVTVPVGRPATKSALTRGKKPSNDEADLDNAAIAERFYSIGGTTVARVCTRAAPNRNREPDVDTLWAAAREAARPEFSGLSALCPGTVGTI